MHIPFDAELGVHPQAEGFTRQRRWEFDPEDEHPLLLHLPYYLLYSSQVCKQADLVHALYLAGESFSPEQKARDFAFYETITVRDSSLSASIQAIVAVETGHVDLALDYLAESALVDLHDLADNTDGGVHLAAMGGTWLAVVAGFGGMRDHDDGLAFSPRLPGGARPDRVPVALPRPAAARRDRPAGGDVRAPRRRGAADPPPRGLAQARARRAGDAPSAAAAHARARPAAAGSRARAPRARRARQRRSRRMTSRRPDQVASMAATFVSTSPRGSAISRTTSSVTSVGTPEARLGQQTHSIPAGARREVERRDTPGQLAALGHEEQDDVERLGRAPAAR